MTWTSFARPMISIRPGSPSRPIFQGVVDQVGENLLEREAVAFEGGKRPDGQRGAELRRRDARPIATDRLDQRAHVDDLG